MSVTRDISRRNLWCRYFERIVLVKIACKSG